MLDNIWEYCKKVHNDNTSWLHDNRFEEEEREEIGIKKYDPPEKGRAGHTGPVASWAVHRLSEILYLTDPRTD
nr:hypothetical protein [Tanacetum cinerariifolium]